MKRRLLLLTLVLVLMSPGMSYGEDEPMVSVPQIDGTIEPGGLTFESGATLTFHVHIYNPPTDSGGTAQESIFHGFKIYSQDGITDLGLTTGGLNTDYCWEPYQGCSPVMFDMGAYAVPNDTNGVSPDTIGFGGLSFMSGGLPAGFDDIAFRFTVGPITADPGEHLIIDSTYLPPMGKWDWIPYVPRVPWQGTIVLTCASVGVAYGQETGLPTVFDLKQNYPNPFNPATAVHFDVPRQSQVSIVIYNVLGHRIKTLVNEMMAAGSYVRHWDGRTDGGELVSSGVYFYKMEADSFVETKKMIMIR